MTTMTYTETLVVTHCWCGIAVGLPENLHTWMLRSSKNSAYCPVGHSFHFTKTLAEEREEMERRVAEANRQARATRDLLAQEERSHSATKGHLTRVRHRVHRGVCPHCHRTFQDLQRHMSSKHPQAVAKE
jgi:hypothetical protein